MRKIAHLVTDRAWQVQFGASSLIASAILGINLFLFGGYSYFRGATGGPLESVLAALAGVLSVAAIALAASGLILCIVALSRRASPETTPARQARSSRRATPGFIAAAGASLVAIIALGTADLLVWSPEAVAPGWSAGRILEALTPLDRWGGLASVAMWVLWWLGVTGVYVVAASVPSIRRQVSESALVTIALAIAAGAMLLHFWAFFGLGMNISDTLPPYVGGQSAFALLYAIGGQLCLIAVVFRTVVRPVRATAAPELVGATAPVSSPAR